MHVRSCGWVSFMQDTIEGISRLETVWLVISSEEI